MSSSCDISAPLAPTASCMCSKPSGHGDCPCSIVTIPPTKASFEDIIWKISESSILGTCPVRKVGLRERLMSILPSTVILSASNLQNVPFEEMNPLGSVSHSTIGRISHCLNTALATPQLFSICCFFETPPKKSTKSRTPE